MTKQILVEFLMDDVKTKNIPKGIQGPCSQGKLTHIYSKAGVLPVFLSNIIIKLIPYCYFIQLSIPHCSLHITVSRNLPY